MRRRHFLQVAGLSLTLPALESMGGAGDLENSAPVKRLFLMTDGYGFHTPFFYPAATGLDYPSNDVIKPLDPLREDVSILIVRHLIHQLFGYALGREVRYRDREQINQLLESAQDNDYKLRDLILEFVSSESFVKR